MNSIIKYIVLTFFFLLILSCNTSEKKKGSQQQGKTDEKEQTYSIDTSGVSIKWTAYKFTDKLGVSGTFDRFYLNLKVRSGGIEALLKGAEMVIHTNSVNSGDAIRDPKLRNSFFKIFNTDEIKGELLDAENGKGALELKMNDQVNATEYSYSLTNDTLFINAHVDLTQWNGKAALDTLNNECYELHTGADGVSKLWPDVDVVLKLPVRIE